MKPRYWIFPIWVIGLLFGQESQNCFLIDFEPKNAFLPPYTEMEKPSDPATVFVTVRFSDTLAKVSKYMFGNAFPAWLGNVTQDPILLDHLQRLTLSFIRYPGGSWSDIFFWDGKAVDVPDSLVNGTTGKKERFYPILGRNSWATTVENYYRLREDLEVQGLITINYAYARYGLSARPVEKAAHYAAEWVRYDAGRTLFWEIGNENGGPWEAGWQIDTLQNQDGQPAIISGALYGRHFRVFVDSMKTMAEKYGFPIYIGGQILHYDGRGSWNKVDWDWNEGFFREAGDAPDFYVIHNYFGTSLNAKSLLDIASTLPKQMMEFIQKEIAEKKAPSRPIAITEWNMGGSGVDLAKTSIINGMQAVILTCEFIRLNYGMSSRWPLANWESDGMLYKGNNASIPPWNPRPDFFYLYYLQQVVGDHVLKVTVSGSKDILAYAFGFSSRHLGIVIINKGKTTQTVQFIPQGSSWGHHFYVYSLIGGTDHEDFSQTVYVNRQGPNPGRWGPLEQLDQIPAYGYVTEGGMVVSSPPRSVQYIWIEPGETGVPLLHTTDLYSRPEHFSIYPTPVNGWLHVEFTPGQYNRLDIFNIRGQLVYTQKILPSQTHVVLQPSFPSGVYFLCMGTQRKGDVKKFLILK